MVAIGARLPPDPDAFRDPHEREAIERVAAAIVEIQRALAATDPENKPGFNITPTGPHDTTIKQLGTTNHIAWTNDESGAPIKEYRIYRAPAGSRSTPTSPVFNEAVQVDTRSAQDISCVNPDGTIAHYSWIDRDFAILRLDPANPGREKYWVTSVTENNKESIPIEVGTVEILTNASGEQSPDVKAGGTMNQFYNPQLFSYAVGAADVAMTGIGSSSRLINAATNAYPIAITTTSNHNLSTGNIVHIDGVAGNLNANGIHRITVTGAATFTLDGIVGSGAYTSGGEVVLCDSQLLFKMPFIGVNNLASHGPWVPVLLYGGIVELKSDGTRSSGEISVEAPVALASNYTGFSQPVNAGRFAEGEHVTFSIYAKCATPGSNFEFALNISGSPGETEAEFNGSQLTSDYQRFVFNGVMPGAPPTRYGISVRVRPLTYPGTVPEIIFTRPMFSRGDQVPAWSGTTDGDVAINRGGTTSEFSWDRPVETIIQRVNAPYA